MMNSNPNPQPYSSIDDRPLYNSRVIKVYLEYLERNHMEIDTDELLNAAGITEEEVEDIGHWFTQRHVDRFQEALVKRTGNPDISYEAGRAVVESRFLGPMKRRALGTIGPMGAYLFASKLHPLLSKAATIKVARLASNRVRISAAPAHGVKEKPYQCKNRKGVIEALGNFFHGVKTRVEHPECIHDGAGRCVYIVEWDLQPAQRLKQVRNVFVPLSALGAVALLVFVPGLDVLVTGLSWALANTALSLAAALLEKKETTENLKASGEAARKHLEEIDLRYNNSMLMRQIGIAAASLPDTERLLRDVCEAMALRLDYDRGMIFLADADKTLLQYRDGFGLDPTQAATAKRTPITLRSNEPRGICCDAYFSKKPFLTNDTEEIKANVHECPEDMAPLLVGRVLIAVPIVCEDESLGVVILGHRRPRRTLTGSDVNLTAAVASQIALSLIGARSFQRLRESEARYRTVLEGIEEGFYEVDLNGTFTYVNDSLCRILGRPPDELVGANFRSVVDEKIVEHVYLGFNEVFKTGIQDRNVDYDIARKNGERRTVEVSVTLIKDEPDGKTTGFRGIVRDVTDRRRAHEELRESERRYRLFAENSSDVIWTKNLTGSVHLCQPVGGAPSGVYARGGYAAETRSGVRSVLF